MIGEEIKAGVDPYAARQVANARDIELLLNYCAKSFMTESIQ